MLQQLLKNIKKNHIINSYGYLICFALALFIIDGVFRNIYIHRSIALLYDTIPTLFTIFWISLFTYIIFLLPKKLKKILLLFIVIFFSIYVMGQDAYYNLFAKFFSVQDASLLKEGAEFADTSYIKINSSLIIACIFGIVIAIYGCHLIPRKKIKLSVKALIPMLMIIFTYFLAKQSIPDVKQADVWDASRSEGNIYVDYTDTTKALLLSGIYEYTFRDLYLTFNPFGKYNNANVIDEIDNTFATRDYEHLENEMTGIFKDKNIILIQLENIDNWMLTKDNMPYLYKLRSQGIDFVNHYAVTFATGKTFNTEFIVNTGLIPQAMGSAPSYIYNRNSYPYSIANLFENAGYTANSFHASGGQVYNRGVVHKTFGYENYYSYSEIGMENTNLDSQLINGYSLMVNADRFMSFIITISAHGPFSMETDSCKIHINEVISQSDSNDEVYLCGLAQAKETDSFVKNLLHELENDGHIEDTVLVFYTDHYAYGTIDSETEFMLKGTNDPNLLSNVPFFAWSNDIEPMQITKVTSSIDILPTLSNLFSLPIDYDYIIGYDAFSEYDAYAMFQDGSIYTGDEYYQPYNSDDSINEEMKNRIVDSQMRLNLGWNILSSDYFKYQ